MQNWGRTMSAWLLPCRCPPGSEAADQVVATAERALEADVADAGMISRCTGNASCGSLQLPLCAGPLLHPVLLMS